MTTMDLETLDRHYFWVERPKAVIEKLLKHFEKVEDVTYVNDGTPSIMINDNYVVYLPNGISSGECETNLYGVIRDSDLQDGNTIFHYTSDIYKVVDIVDCMIDDDKLISKKEMAHRMSMIMDDLAVIRKQLTSAQLKGSTDLADDLQTHFNNIEIACDLNSNESLDWKLYSTLL